MKEVINILPISSYLSTEFRIREVIKALDRLQSNMFHKKEPFVTTLEKEIPYPLNETLKKLAIENEVKIDDTEEVDRFLSMLRDDIQAIPKMTLTLSFEPTNDLIRELNEWITLNLKAVITLDFMVDPSLIAGAQIAYKGKIIDHSLRKRIERLMSG